MKNLTYKLNNNIIYYVFFFLFCSVYEILVGGKKKCPEIFANKLPLFVIA